MNQVRCWTGTTEEDAAKGGWRRRPGRAGGRRGRVDGASSISPSGHRSARPRAVAVRRRGRGGLARFGGNPRTGERGRRCVERTQAARRRRSGASGRGVGRRGSAKGVEGGAPPRRRWGPTRAGAGIPSVARASSVPCAMTPERPWPDARRSPTDRWGPGTSRRPPRMTGEGDRRLRAVDDDSRWTRRRPSTRASPPARKWPLAGVPCVRTSRRHRLRHHQGVGRVRGVVPRTSTRRCSSGCGCGCVVVGKTKRPSRWKPTPQRGLRRTRNRGVARRRRIVRRIGQRRSPPDRPLATGRTGAGPYASARRSKG